MSKKNKIFKYIKLIFLVAVALILIFTFTIKHLNNKSANINTNDLYNTSSG
ncbi:MAG: hypothetical protein SO274_11085 [Turicibacter bilis]|nr:hypothetical protein [Turicibacter bilis]